MQFNIKSSISGTGLFLGPSAALIVSLLIPDSYINSAGDKIILTQAAASTAAIGTWMAIWWITEAISIYATALIPLVFFPLTGATTIEKAASPYGHPLIFLFMGGFIIALAMQKWNLHKRIALSTIKMIGKNPHFVIAGFMAITAFLSMWVSNTATTIMMLPIALSILNYASELSDKKVLKNFSIVLFLGIAYAASIGGVGTLVGTPPNVFLAGFISENTDIEITFVKWMMIGIPLVVVFLPLIWILLVFVLYPVDKNAISLQKIEEHNKPINRAEWLTLIVFVLTAFLWIFRPLIINTCIAGYCPFKGLSDPGIAMFGAFLLFVLPVDWRKKEFVMDWRTAVKLPWGILILFGGGLSLAAAIKHNGIGEFIGSQIHILKDVPEVVLVMCVTALMIFLTELTSNTASTATLVPIFFAITIGLDLPALLLIIPTTMAASCAFMLPVATPPNAIVFSSGQVTIHQMVKAGIWFNLLGIALITIWIYILYI